MDLEYPRLVNIKIFNTKPITQTWRYKQRKTILQKYSLLHIYQKKLYTDINSVHKALCLEELLHFIERQRQFLIKQCYSITIETHRIFPMEIHEKICRYITVPIKFDI